MAGMRNPLDLLPARTLTAAASVPVASKNKLPRSMTPLFTRSNAGQAIDTIRTSGTVYSIVHRISSDVAKQAWQVVRHRPGVPDDQLDPVDHAFDRIWERPNERMTPTGRAFRQLAGMYLELLGEACLLVVTTGRTGAGQPMELWPLRPDRLQPVADPFHWLAGWIYTSEDGESVPLLPEQVIQLKYPDPADPYRGLSPLRAAMTEIDTAVFASEWQANVFANGALPGGIVTTDEHLSPTDFSIWVERWNEQHQGTDNAGRVALMDKGGKFISQQMSMVDMQLAELVQLNHGNIREAWGISKTMLGSTEDVNRATALAAEQIYGRFTLDDRVDLWTEAGNELLSRFGSGRRQSDGRPRLRVVVDGSIVPDDIELDAKDRDSKVRAVVALAKEGGDLVALAEAYGLPEFDLADQLAPAQLAALAKVLKESVGKVISDEEARAVLETAGFPLIADSFELAADKPDPPPLPPGQPFGAPPVDGEPFPELDPPDTDDDDDEDDDD
jgi:HK97 family phage portal protein